MKIVVVSDSHGDFIRLQKIVDKEKPFDMLIHCGDGAPDPLRTSIPEGTLLVRASGNVDRYNNMDIEDEVSLEAEGFRILVVHGDRFGVRDGEANLKTYALQNHYDAVFYGHTHLRSVSEDRPLILNPGPANRGSYAVVYLNPEDNSINSELMLVSD